MKDVNQLKPLESLIAGQSQAHQRTTAQLRLILGVDHLSPLSIKEAERGGALALLQAVR